MLFWCSNLPMSFISTGYWIPGIFNSDLKNVENVEKLFLIEKNKNLTFKCAFHSSDVLNSASYKKQVVD